jgi:hypothetical protein
MGKYRAPMIRRGEQDSLKSPPRDHEGVHKLKAGRRGPVDTPDRSQDSGFHAACPSVRTFSGQCC